MPEEHVTAVECDLAALLAVEPSPAFAAGVRGRIASACPSRVRHAWMWAAAAAAVAAVTIGAIALVAPDDPNVAPLVLSRGRTSDVRLALVPAASAVAERRAPARVRPAVATAPAVIVDRAQAEAVRRLLAVAARARASRLELPAEPVNARRPDLSGPAAVPPLAVDPVLVELLPVPELNRENKGVQQ